MTPVFGDIVLLPFPLAGGEGHDKRPAVVISSDNHNRSRPELVVLAISSQVRFPLQPGETMLLRWQAAGLLKPSMFKPIVTTVEPSQVLGVLGNLQPEDVVSLRKVLAFIFD